MNDHLRVTRADFLHSCGACAAAALFGVPLATRLTATPPLPSAEKKAES